ncbi:MAG TPA: hypothetical protein VFH61_07315 [Thermoleophilia bacterium]|nr:hypothetical protein [Thermoleophilia bacterium]
MTERLNNYSEFLGDDSMEELDTTPLEDVLRGYAQACATGFLNAALLTAPAGDAGGFVRGVHLRLVTEEIVNGMVETLHRADVSEHKEATEWWLCTMFQQVLKAWEGLSGQQGKITLVKKDEPNE